MSVKRVTRYAGVSKTPKQKEREKAKLGSHDHGEACGTVAVRGLISADSTRNDTLLSSKY